MKTTPPPTPPRGGAQRTKNLNPWLALAIIVLLYLLGSTLESSNIEQDQQAQEDCRLQDISYE